MGRQKTFKGVRAASESTIQIEFAYPDAATRQRERLPLKPTPANLERAFVHLSQIKESIKNGSFDYAATFPKSKRAHKFQNKRLLSTFLRHWLPGQPTKLKASTYATHARFINNQLGPLGRMRMDAIRWADIRDWARKQTVSQKTINNKMSILRTAFQEAFDDDLIANNPFAGRKAPKQRSVVVKKDEIDPFSMEEIKAIISAAANRERWVIQFGFATGLRISELIGLSWSKVDFVNSTIRIDEVKTQYSKGLEEPKTQKAIRDVMLNSVALEALQCMKAFSYLKGKEIFQNPRSDDRWLGDMQFRERMWKRILKKAGVRYRYPYQMRHTYASMSLQAGESPFFVANQIGHTDPGFTMRTYHRYIPNAMTNAGKLLEAAWGEKASVKASISTQNHPKQPLKRP